MCFTLTPHQFNLSLPAHGKTQSCIYVDTDGHERAQESLNSSLLLAQHTFSPVLFPGAGAGVSTTCPHHPRPQSSWDSAHPCLHEQQERGHYRALQLPGPVLAGEIQVQILALNPPKLGHSWI